MKVAVVGGGVIGLFTGHYLEKAGAEVVTLAPSTGKALISLLFGAREPLDLEPFDPSRFA